MSAYLIGRITITDPERYREYTQLTPGIIAQYGGRFIVRGGEVITLEGTPANQRLVVVKFPSVAQAQAFYNSSEYRQAMAIRQSASEGHFVIVAGVAPETT